MPQTTDRTTATRIKEKIVECDRLVVIATPNALHSLWVPWELGCADGTKGVNNIAVFPVVERSAEYDGTEYVGIYPSIMISDDGSLHVRFCDSQVYVSLADWLSRK